MQGEVWSTARSYAGPEDLRNRSLVVQGFDGISQMLSRFWITTGLWSHNCIFCSKHSNFEYFYFDDISIIFIAAYSFFESLSHCKRAKGLALRSLKILKFDLVFSSCIVLLYILILNEQNRLRSFRGKKNIF